MLTGLRPLELSFTVTSLLAVVAVGATEPGAGLSVGSAAPPLSVDKLLQAPPEAPASWEGLRGRAVVLEFWATWCAPCVGAIPHLNALSERFKDKPVVFIAVTSEDEARVGRFLQKRPIRGWVGLDTDRSMFRDYGVVGIPATVLVDANGVVAAVTAPQAVTVTVLEDVLAGRPIHVAAGPATAPTMGVRANAEPPAPADAAEPLLEVSIRPSTVPWESTSEGPGLLRLTGFDAPGTLSRIFDVPGYRIDLRAELPAGRYDVVGRMSSARADELRALLREAAEMAFGITTRRETVEVEVYLLNVPEDGGAKLLPTAMESGGSSGREGESSIELVNAPVARLAGLLGTRLGRPVADETGLAGGYDVTLRWEPNEPQALIAAVREQLGLHLTPARRPVEFLVVERASPAGGE